MLHELASWLDHPTRVSRLNKGHFNSDGQEKSTLQNRTCRDDIQEGGENVVVIGI